MRLPSWRCTSTASPKCTPRATRAGLPSMRSKVTAIEGTSLTARVTAKAIRWVYETFSGRPASCTRWLSCRRRRSSTSTRTVRKLVAVGTWRLSSMYFTRAAAAPRKGIAGGFSPPPLAGGGRGGGGVLLGGGGGGGGGCLLLPFNRFGDIATADRAPRAASLDGRQVDSLCLREQLGAFRNLDRCGDLATVGRRRWGGHGAAGLQRLLGLGGGRLGDGLRGGRLFSRHVAVRADRDLSQRRTHGDRLPGLGENLHQGPTRRRGHFGIHLVGGDLNQPFAFANLVARLLQPLGNGPLCDRFTHLRQGDLHGRLGHGMDFTH